MGRAGGQHLAGGLLDLGDGGAHRTGLRLALAGSLDQLIQASAQRQQQRRLFAQMFGQAGFQGAQLLGQAAEQRQLLADRHMLGQGLFQARDQPADGGGPGARLARMQFVPVVEAEVVQQAETGLQAGEGFALVQAPDQPGGDAQILGVGAEQGLAVFADFLPVDGAGFMQGGGLTQLGFEYFVFSGITHVSAGKVPFIDRKFGQL